MKNLFLQLTAKFTFWFFITLLPKSWPDIFFDNRGLTVNNDKRSFSLHHDKKSTLGIYNPMEHSVKRNVQEAVLFMLDEIDDKIDKVSKGIL